MCVLIKLPFVTVNSYFFPMVFIFVRKSGMIYTEFFLLGCRSVSHPIAENHFLYQYPEKTSNFQPRRITLTLPMLNNFSRDVVFVGAGGSKGKVLEASFKSNYS